MAILWLVLGGLVAAIFLAAALPVGRWLADYYALPREVVDPGVLATVVGIVAGAPLALIVARSLEWLGDRARDAQRARDRKELLGLLRVDLIETLDELVERDRGDPVGRFLRSDLWASVTTGGRLKLLDPPLLAQVGRAYSFIESTANLERMQWEEHASHDHWDKVRSSVPAIILANANRQHDEHTKAAIDVALEKLSLALGVPPPPNKPLREPSPDDDDEA